VPFFYSRKTKKRIFYAAAISSGAGLIVRLLLDGIISLKLVFQLRSFLSGDFAGGGVISPGFNGVAGLGTEGASGGGIGAGSLSLQPANAIVKPKRVTANSDTIFFIVIHLVCKEI
jgi:hypothetical protein